MNEKLSKCHTMPHEAERVNDDRTEDGKKCEVGTKSRLILEEEIMVVINTNKKRN